MPAERRRDGRRRRGPDEPDEETRESVEIHEAYLEHRLAGGKRPSAQLYLRALERFRRLPGAIRARPGMALPAEPDSDQADDEDGPG
jgi:hypothetical protein